MTAKAVFAAACLVLTGCNTMPTSTDGRYEHKLDCQSASACRVKVTVACLPICNVSVDSAAVIIKVSERKDTITWDLDDSYFTFADNNRGVVFDADGREAFHCRTESGGRRVICSSKNPNFGVFKYTINVASRLLIAAPLDPWVINN